MKKIVVISAIALIALASCYVPGRATGSITFVLPSAVETKAIGDTDTFDTARVYLLSGVAETVNAFLNFGDGAIYIDVAIDAGTATVEGIPEGNWDVLLSLGSFEGATDTFYVQKYGNSGTIKVLPGVDNTVPISISPNPFVTSTVLFGKNVVGVAVDSGPDIFAATEDQAYTDGGAGFGSLATATSSGLNAATEINSVSIGLTAGGTETVYLSGSDGIWFGDGAAAWALIHPVVAGIPVLQSGAYQDTTPVRTLVYYQRDGGLGGVNLDTFENIDVNLSALVSGQPVYDFEINDPDDVVYFASKLGALALDENLFDGAYNEINALEAAKFFDVIDGTYKTVLSLSYDSNGPVVYVGTDSGIYQGIPQNIGGANEPFTGPLTVVDNTPDTKYDKIEVSDGGDYVAFLSNFNLYLLETSSDSIVEIPFYAGLPGTVSAMTWTPADELLISGSEGLVLLSVTPALFL